MGRKKREFVQGNLIVYVVRTFGQVHIVQVVYGKTLNLLNSYVHF